MNKLKYRMYFFVPYNISPIQQAIQAGHAALRHAHKYKDDPEYIEFIENNETWIILNGGTTNKSVNPEYRGTLNIILDELTMNGIHRTYFEEIDLNDAVTAVCFLADERVWDYETYPEFVDWLIGTLGYISPQRTVEMKMLKYEDLIRNPKYPEWVECIGGEKNLFLRNLLKGKKKA